VYKEPTASQVDFATQTLYHLGRHIWRGHGTNMLPYIATCLGSTVGDIQRQSRKMFEGRRPDLPVVGNELGNLALSSIRWMGDLELDPVQCIRVAAGAQRRYADEH
jgi:hypothetical protein